MGTPAIGVMREASSVTMVVLTRWECEMKKIVFSILAVLLSAASAQMTWTCASESAPWAPRSTHAVVVFNSKMWLLGGVSRWQDSICNDVWSSTDGVSWTLVTESASWCPRFGHRVVEFRDTMWLFGGCTHYPDSLLNDV
jgi:hypothetical protein